MYYFRTSSIPYVIIWFALSLISILACVVNPLIVMNENQILYLFSAAAQVIAAIYGLIITGYIFLRNELDRKVIDDETLEEIVQYLKKEYFLSIMNISIITVLVILSCLFVISIENHKSFLLIDLSINISISTITTELVLIVMFVIKILNPQSLEMASNKIKKKYVVTIDEPKGSLEEFLKSYNEIEYILDKYGNEYANTTAINMYPIRKKSITKTKLVYILNNENKIDKKLRDELIELISLRNSIIHGTDLTVSSDNVQYSRNVLVSLKNALGVNE